MTRIRKPHRNNASVRDVDTVQPTAGSLLRAWDFEGDGRLNLTTPGDVENGNKTTTTTKVVSPSRQSPSDVSKMLLPQREDQLRGVQVDGGAEQATRHYVRQRNVFGLKGDVASAFVPFQASTVAARNMSPIESKGKEAIKQGESEELLSGDAKIAKMPPPASVASKSKLNPRQTEDNDKSHPSTVPEGSLLHALYLQLLAAVSEGITWPELFTGFEQQTALPMFVTDWKAQVWFHLKNNPHIDQVKEHFLLRAQRMQQQPKLDATVSLNRPYMCVSPETVNISGHYVGTTAQSNDSPPAAALEPALEGIQTWRKAYDKTVEAVLTESAMEFEKMQHSHQGNTQMPSSPASDFVTTDSQVTHTPRRKRKSSSGNGEQDDRVKTYRGSLQAMRARILAETGKLQVGVPCARKDDARNWRCPLTAMEGFTLCRHHKTLRMKMQEESKTRRSAEAETKRDTPGKRANGRLKSDSVTVAGESEMCTTENEDNVGGAHAVEALVDLQSRRMVPLSTFEAVFEVPATPTNKVHEEAEPSKSKTPSEDEPVHRNIVPGSYQALHVRILAESGKQSGVRSCARKDGSNDSARKTWQCPPNAAKEDLVDLQSRLPGYHSQYHGTFEAVMELDPASTTTNQVHEEAPESSKSKTPSESEPVHRNIHYVERATPGPLQALYARILAESGKQSGERSCARKDGSNDSARKTWQSWPPNAKEAFVDHLQNRRMVSLNTFEAVTADPATTTNKVHEEAPESSKSKTREPVHRNIHYVERATPGSLQALHRRILAETGQQSGVQCARRDRGNNSSRKWQCPLTAKEGRKLCDHHFLLEEKKKARYAARKVGLKGSNATVSDMGLPKSHTQFDEVPASKSSEKDVEIHGSPDEELESPSESTDTDEELHNRLETAKGKSKEDDDLDSNAVRVLPLMVKIAPKRRYVAAKKSAANMNGVKGNSPNRVTSPLIRPPTIPPLHAMYGVRRKAVKNRSLLSL